MAEKKRARQISAGYDIDKLKNTDEFDPIAWFEGTGEDLGLPDAYRRKLDRLKKKPEPVKS
jgi:hypothetical protein